MKRFLAAGLLALALPSVALGQVFTLISPDEYTAHRQAITDGVERPFEPLKATRSLRARPPGIELLRPDLGAGAAATPTDIELLFKPAANRQIDMESLTILYGWLGIDITSRVLTHATVTENSVLANGAELPSGSHSITVRIADSEGSEAEREFDFTIE